MDGCGRDRKERRRGRRKMSEAVDRKATRNYPSYAVNDWKIWEVLAARRSTRKYVPWDPPEDFLSSLREVLGLALEARGVEGDGVRAITEPREVERIRRVAYRGFTGKINLWLARAPVSGILALVVPEKDMEEDRPRFLPRAAMAAEDVVLWLTEKEVATCWIGGIDPVRVSGEMRTDAGMLTAALVVFGRSASTRSGFNYDRVMYGVLSRRRKPLSVIASLGEMGEPYPLGEPPREPFMAVEEQGVESLLRAVKGGIGGGTADVPLSFSLEACLEAARLAPSGGNMQEWHFVVMESGEKLRRLEELCGTTGGRAAVVAAGRPGNLEEVLLDKPFWMLDVPIALSHMSLAASSLGLAPDVVLDFPSEEVDVLAGLKRGWKTVGVMFIR